MPKSQSEKRRTMPTWNQVFDFWSKTSLPVIKHGFPSEFSENRCFACGVKYPFGVKLERAHIHPLWLGGPNDASNLHLLCHVCHKDSENLGRPDKPKSLERYWAWFFSRDIRKRSISSRIRNGDPGVFEEMNGLEWPEMFVRSWREVIFPVYEHDWELLDAMAKSFGFESWDDATDASERIVIV